MQSTQLYIEDQRVDLFNDEIISLTQTIQNVKDIEKVFTDFSKSFTIPASKTNNKIFKHYYNTDITNGFDARKKVDARLELNHLPFKEGKIKLEGVDLKNNIPYAYRVTFFGNTVSLKDLMGEDKLGALTWLGNFTRTYDANNVRLDLQTDGIDLTVDSTTYTDAFCMPLLSAQTELSYNASGTVDYFNADGTINPLGANLYATGTNYNGVYFEELKYAIRVYLIVLAIEKRYGITFSSDSFIKDTSNPQFYDLYMWMHREKGFAFKADEVTNQYKNFIADTTTMTRIFCTNSTLIAFNFTGSQTFTYQLNVVTAPASDYSIVIYKNGVPYQQGSFSGGTSGVAMSGTGANGNYEIYVTGTSSNSIRINWIISDTFLSESNTFISSSAQTLTANPLWNAQQQMPKIKVIDFLSGLFKMFNLTAYKNNAGEIVVKKLDDYYASGTTRDVTKYIDVSQSSVDTALPYKEVSFQYKGRGTKLAQLYEQEQEIGWGTTTYFVDNDFIGDVYTVEAPFEHMQFYRQLGTTVQFGSCVDDNEQAYIGDPILFYRSLISAGTSIRFLNNSTSYTNISYYCIPSNSVSLSAATNDDTNHFSVEINEYTPTDVFDGSLFANYYQDYISDVFNNERRLLKIKAFLPLSFLINYNLADTLIINAREYRINSIITNLNTGESELELLNIV